jgi:hypothetical protein
VDDLLIRVLTRADGAGLRFAFAFARYRRGVGTALPGAAATRAEPGVLEPAVPLVQRPPATPKRNSARAAGFWAAWGGTWTG